MLKGLCWGLIINRSQTFNFLPVRLVGVHQEMHLNELQWCTSKIPYFPGYKTTIETYFITVKLGRDFIHLVVYTPENMVVIIYKWKILDWRNNTGIGCLPYTWLPVPYQIFHVVPYKLPRVVLSARPKVTLSALSVVLKQNF